MQAGFDAGLAHAAGVVGRGKSEKLKGIGIWTVCKQ